MNPQKLTGQGEQSFIMGELGRSRYLAYIRITVNGKPKIDGTGPTPAVLTDKAKAYDSIPILIRVNLNDRGSGLQFGGWDGAYEFVDEVKRTAEYVQNGLLKGRSVEDYLRITGKTSELSLKILGETPSIDLRLFIDGEDVADWRTVSPSKLARASHINGEHEVFTCSCGDMECAGIYRGVDVAHERGLTVWRAYGLERPRVFVFDTKKQREVILKVLLEADEMLKNSKAPDKQFGPYDDYRLLETSLSHAHKVG